MNKVHVAKGGDSFSLASGGRREQSVGTTGGATGRLPRKSGGRGHIFKSILGILSATAHQNRGSALSCRHSRRHVPQKTTQIQVFAPATKTGSTLRDVSIRMERNLGAKS